MGMNCSEDPVKMGVFVLPKVSFIMGTFSDPQHMILAFHSGVTPPPPWSRVTVWRASSP